MTSAPAPDEAEMVEKVKAIILPRPAASAFADALARICARIILRAILVPAILAAIRARALIAKEGG